jgi:hypothetical protein
MRPDLRVLCSPGFLAALLLLLLNDCALKQLFPGVLTGKLSDFAGLFVFPMFWAAFAPRRRTFAYASTALCFIFWKSSYSQPIIDCWNALPFFNIRRTVDPTDLLALSVLPLSYRYTARRLLLPAPVTRPAIRKIAGYVFVFVSLFAFAATTMKDDHMVSGDREYEFRMTKDELLHHLEKDIGLIYVNHYRFDDKFVEQTKNWPSGPMTEEDRDQYSFSTSTRVCNNTVFAAVTLHQKGSGSVLKVEYLIYNCDAESPEREREAVRAFEHDVVDKLRAIEGGRQ